MLVLRDRRKQEDLGIHERLARDYASEPRATSVYLDFWYRVLTAHLDPGRGRAILDFCCGAGQMLRRLRRMRPRRLVGVDLSDAMLKVARGAAQEADLVRGDGEELPLASASFDIVFCIGALHHLPAASVGVKEIARVLRPGGCLVVSEPCADSFLLRLPRRVAPRLRCFPRGHRAIAGKELECLLAEQGLVLEHRARFGHLGFVLCALDHQLAIVRRVPRWLQEPAGRFLTWLDGILMRVFGIAAQAAHIVVWARKASNAGDDDGDASVPAER